MVPTAPKLELCIHGNKLLKCRSKIKKSKGSVYIAQYPVRWTAQSALHFLPSRTGPVHSDTNSASLGSILAMQQLRNGYSFTFQQLSIARYSFIQLSEQGLQWRELKCSIFEMVAKRDSNPSSLDCESSILPLPRSTGEVHLNTRTGTKQSVMEI